MQAHEGEWISAPDVYRGLHGDEGGTRELSSMGCVMKYLPMKDTNVHVQAVGRVLVYKWTNEERPADEPISEPLSRRSLNAKIPDTGMKYGASPVVHPMLENEDMKLIREVLEDYARLVIETKPAQALKCAFLSGKLATMAWAGNAAQNPPDGYAYTKVEPSRPARRVIAPPCDEPDEPIELAEMPEGMTYRELVDFIAKSGVKFGRDWREFASYAGMDADYFERVATGQVAQPSKHTMERVYSAIFTVRS